MAGGHRMDGAEDDTHREVGGKDRPVARLREAPDPVGEGQVDFALDRDQVLEQIYWLDPAQRGCRQHDVSQGLGYRHQH